MRRVLLPAVVLLSLSLAPFHGRAADVDWFGGVRLSDGGRTFLNLSVAHFGGDQRQLAPVVQRLPAPEDDLPVLLFLAQESRRPPQFILDLRLRGLSWWDVMVQVGVPPARLFVALPADPGPPYGNAWGYYRKHPRERRGAVMVTDRQFCDLVGARVVGRAYGVDPTSVLDARRGGTRVVDYVVVKEKEKRGKRGGVAVADARGDERGDRPRKGQDKGGGSAQRGPKSKGHGNH